MYLHTLYEKLEASVFMCHSLSGNVSITLTTNSIYRNVTGVPSQCSFRRAQAWFAPLPLQIMYLPIYTTNYDLCVHVLRHKIMALGVLKWIKLFRILIVTCGNV